MFFMKIRSVFGDLQQVCHLIHFLFWQMGGVDDVKKIDLTKKDKLKHSNKLSLFIS